MMSEYQYYFRPGYGSDDFLLEFLPVKDRYVFFVAFLGTIKELEPKVLRVTDLWMNDEYVCTIDTVSGAFELSIDTWGVFIMGRNQICIKQINTILAHHKLFEKVEVDLSRYL